MNSVRNVIHRFSCSGQTVAKWRSLKFNRRCTSSMTAIAQDLSGELNDIKKAGTYKIERVISGRQGVHIMVADDTRKIVNFCANNYLGLSSDPKVIAAGKQALDSHGSGLSSVRFICGTQDIHRELERKIARFHSRDDAILYAACFDANAGLFEVLLGAQDAIITDQLNHASIIDGIRLSKAKRCVYNHLDLADLETKLIETNECRRRLIVTDGVFSMDGDVAPLREICELADKHNAMVFTDDCHATGFFGATGRGTEEYAGVLGRVDIINSTLGKALGGAMGGYTTGPQPLIDLLRQRSRPYLFSNSLAPAVVGAATKVLDMLTENSDMAASLLKKTLRFRDQLSEAGFTVAGNREHPICPVMLGDARLASEFADRMLRDEGIYVIGFSFPVVPKGKARIRVQISAAHTDSDIDRCAAAFANVGRQMRVV